MRKRSADLEVSQHLERGLPGASGAAAGAPPASIVSIHRYYNSALLDDMIILYNYIIYNYDMTNSHYLPL